MSRTAIPFLAIFLVLGIAAEVYLLVSPSSAHRALTSGSPLSIQISAGRPAMVRDPYPLIASYVQPKTENRQKISVKGTSFEVDIARTEAERERGLSGRSGLAEGSGMLFIFEKADRYGFWMKEMRFPIDILWIDGKERVVHIVRSVPPDSYPLVYTPDKPALFVLELPAGSADRHAIRINDTFDLSNVVRH